MRPFVTEFPIGRMLQLHYVNREERYSQSGVQSAPCMRSCCHAKMAHACVVSAPHLSMVGFRAVCALYIDRRLCSRLTSPGEQDEQSIG